MQFTSSAILRGCGARRDRDGADRVSWLALMPELRRLSTSIARSVAESMRSLEQLGHQIGTDGDRGTDDEQGRRAWISGCDAADLDAQTSGLLFPC